MGESGVDGINGVDGLSSLIDISQTTSGTDCPNGGVRIDVGIDTNDNGFLEPSEVQETEFVCNGSPRLDEQIRFRMSYGGNTRSTTPVTGGSLINFRKDAFAEIDSIVFTSDPYVASSVNTSFVELYDLTNDMPIANSLLSTNKTFVNREFLYSANLFDVIPDEEITLGVRFWSGTEGEFAASRGSDTYLLLYRGD